jgi:hypothetical protein
MVAQRLVHPRKRTFWPAAGAAEMGREPPLALQKNARPLQSRSTFRFGEGQLTGQREAAYRRSWRAVALGNYAMQLVSTAICYVNRAFVATAVTEFLVLHFTHNPG